MKFLKNNLKLIIGFILGVILTGGIVYAAVTASEIDYTTTKNSSVKNVEQALNDLYTKGQAGANHEIACWVGYTNYISGSLIKKENNTATKDLSTPTPNIGDKIRIERLANSSQVTCYAVQTGNFRITIVDQNGDPTVYEQYTTAGNAIVTASSLTLGIIEALF